MADLLVLRAVALAGLLICVGACNGAAGEKAAAGAPAGGSGAAAAPASGGAASGSGTAAAGMPVPGVDVSNLAADEQAAFYQLVDSLPSPCGKAHSLRKSVTGDPDCRRAPFAARYLALMLGDGADAETAKKVWEGRYGTGADATDAHRFSLGEDVPHTGPIDAPVQLVEFFDYNCHVCKDTLPLLEQGLAAHPADVVLFYKQFPLGRWPDSPAAAQAAIAAGKQGKFVEMHTILFANQGSGFTQEDLDGYARKLGLDMKKFAADYAAAAAQVEADHAEGKEAGVTATPTIFINGRPNHAPHDARYVEAWIEEELAAQR